VGGAGTVLTNPIPVVQANSTSTGAFTSGPIPASGLIQYNFGQISPGTWGISSSGVNVAAAVAPLASVVGTTNAINFGFHEIGAAANDAGFRPYGGAFVASPSSREPNKWAGGPWIRVNAGQTTIESVGSSVLPNGIVSSAASRVRTNFSGFQGGVDTGVLNLNGSGLNMHFGVTAGQVVARAQELQTVGLTDYTVPFVGLYGAMTYDNFFADLQVRRDFLDMRVTNPFAGLLSRQVEGDGTNVSGSAGYHLALNGFFIEPQVGFSATRTNIDVLPVTGGSLAFDTIHSLIGRAGVRIGTSLTANNMLWQPFVTANLLHEFESDASANYVDVRGIPVPLATTRIGTFGQLGLGLTIAIPESGIVGFVRGDFRFGENVSASAVVGGVRATF
jgi:outer membrane autotransporter protein